ncbi:TAXI family TRAP transporter solute-binding subunit [Variovorax sp. J22R24]|uniref:TAXI family TRAP transporter solute-binding subunit n=1 Tax=Variovorax gracilis TaxID=3053502 RepID=UPI00257707D5|nr:TAXI family TRAP transporter solute-binding subunit [Variovorax sp. J22R24]MDM0109447.1 TAXI family TRAP transporter solute-binding subunit [Variovorax sp. J22R24]
MSCTQFDELRYKRLAVGSSSSGMRAFMEPLLAANGITSFNTELVPLTNLPALRALQAGQVDAAFLIGPVPFPAIFQALHDPDLKLLSLHARKPISAIEQHIPVTDVKLIGTRAMLVSREGLSPPIVNLLLEAPARCRSGNGWKTWAGSSRPPREAAPL